MCCLGLVFCCAQGEVREANIKSTAATEAKEHLQEQLNSTKKQLEAATAQAEQLQQQLKHEQDEKVGLTESRRHCVLGALVLRPACSGGVLIGRVLFCRCCAACALCLQSFCAGRHYAAWSCIIPVGPFSSTAAGHGPTIHSYTCMLLIPGGLSQCRS
jgi:hypothetical protein